MNKISMNDVPKICPLCKIEQNHYLDFRSYKEYELNCDRCDYIFTQFRSGHYYWMFYIDNFSVSLYFEPKDPKRYRLEIYNRNDSSEQSYMIPIFKINFNNYHKVVKRLKLLLIYR